jgi:uncharacterized membrane protein
MLMLPRIVFVVLLVLVAAVIVGSSGTLPERVATHFGRGGMANGFMSRDGYIAFMLAFAVLLPLFVAAMTGVVPRMIASKRHIPNYDYWFAPARREASTARLVSHACLAGCLIVFFIGGLHVVILDANTHTPARMSEPVFFAMLAAFLVGIAAWIVWFRCMFRRLG